MIDLQKWDQFVSTLEIEPLFVTVSGAHLYGFPSRDSDVDLRGCHQLPLAEIVGLRAVQQTYEKDGFHDDIEIDIVSHDIGKYLGLMVKNNGYVMEQIFSPLVVRGQAFLDKLRPIAERCITRHHYHHYRGFYGAQRKLIEKQEQKRAKQVLYAYRVLLTGIHLLRTGEVEANLLNLNKAAGLPFIQDLVDSKVTEKVAPKNLDWAFHAAELEKLESTLEAAFNDSTLPEDPQRDAVHDFLVGLRLGRD